MAWKPLVLTGWGRTSRVSTLAARPERVRDAVARLGEAEQDGIISYGGGRSYGDCALNDGGRTLLTGRLDRFLAFDEASGELVVEAGATFRSILDVFLPRGWLSPVQPGTAFATVGGAVANDIHGKNHEAVGSFGNHVRWIDLLIPSGEVVRISPAEHPELFAATVGGIGLTGVILAVCFGMVRVPSNGLEVTERPIKDLDDFLAAFTARQGDEGYSVGWIDGLARGGRLGRGHLTTARPAEADVPRPRGGTLRLPVDLPGVALNPLTVGAFNAAYRRRKARAAARGQATVPYESFLFPLDRILAWNRMYGRAGFRQFQCVVPLGEGAVALRKLLEEIGRSRRASFLTVLKMMGEAGVGHLSFPMPGFTLALDFPRSRRTDELLARLERVTRDHGGRVYLAKDSCLSPQGFAEMYPNLGRFRAALAELDPAERMRSDMARRLRIREARA